MQRSGPPLAARKSFGPGVFDGRALRNDFSCLAPDYIRGSACLRRGYLGNKDVGQVIMGQGGARVLRRFEVLGQFQALALVVRFQSGAVEGFRYLPHAFVDQSSDDLGVFQHEGSFVTAHFKHPA